MNGPADQRDMRWVWLASEVLLVATSIAGVQLLSRLYEEGQFFGPMVFTVIAGHLTLIALRWLGFNALVSGIASFVTTILAIVAMHYSGSAIAAVIPTSTTIDEFRADLDTAGDVFNTLVTPVPAVTGFIVAGSLIFWFLTYAADWAAFRMFAPGQALLPMLTVLIFVSLLGVETDRIPTTAMLVITGVLFLLAHRAAFRVSQGVWLDDGPGRGYAALMTAGVIVAAVAILAGVLAGPSVPGADEAPLVQIGDEGRQENEPIEVISPLVQIQPRLIEQSEQVLFTVETTERAYWRIAALDVFDGVLWRSQGQFRGTSDGLEVAYESPAVPSTRIDATFDLGALNVVWAPAAYLPTAVETLTPDVSLNYEAESATFIVDTNDQRVSDGLRYRVQSVIPNLTPELLRNLPSTTTDTIDARYLDLPSDFSPLARAEAERITAGLTSDYDKARALQDYFRDNFTYDIDVAKGHDIRRLEDFLTVQRGYCEQFAGTFASMARAIGIPARVATGFTTGVPETDNPNLLFVRGKHAHAWPEVWIAGAGWVAFEPTPGRGAPNATEYTGAPESQASDRPEPAESEASEAQPEAAAAPEPAAPTPTPVPQNAEQPQPVEPEPEPEPATAEAGDDGTDWTLPLILLGVVAAFAAWALGVPYLKRLAARRRVDRTGDDTRRLVTLSWSETVDRLDALGHPPIGSETLIEYAERLAVEVPSTAPAFVALTALTSEAAYAPDPPAADKAEESRRLATEIARSVGEDQPWLVRGAHEIDPRPLLRLRDPVGNRADRLAAGATTVLETSVDRTPGEPIGDALLSQDDSAI